MKAPFFQLFFPLYLDRSKGSRSELAPYIALIYNEANDLRKVIEFFSRSIVTIKSNDSGAPRG